ncbi:MAG: hypothetical protein KKC19_04445 [Nanoarchaeota archaeon]|nr:hypothetical protein [Nanoarchaeota archaeon]
MVKSKKKTIKINFKDFGTGSDPRDNYFTNILRMRYNVVISDNPDYVFYSVYPEAGEEKGLSEKGDFIRKISPRLYIWIRKLYVILTSKKSLRTISPRGDFIKIFYASEHVRPNMEECDWAFSTYLEEEINHPHYFRIASGIINDYPFSKYMKLPLKRNINFEKIKKEKIKFCNFIYSQEINPRNNFFKELNKYKRVDSPGRCMNNMPSISHKSPKESRLSKNWVKSKLDFINQYKFTIAFENRTEDGWTTEKLTHPLLVGSIPIYFGNKKVGKDFNSKCFINANDFKSVEEVVKHIVKVDTDNRLYQQYLEQPIFSNKESVYMSNEKKMLKILTKIIESKK